MLCIWYALDLHWRESIGSPKILLFNFGISFQNFKLNFRGHTHSIDIVVPTAAILFSNHRKCFILSVFPPTQKPLNGDLTSRGSVSVMQWYTDAVVHWYSDAVVWCMVRWCRGVIHGVMQWCDAWWRDAEVWCMVWCMAWCMVWCMVWCSGVMHDVMQWCDAVVLLHGVMQWCYCMVWCMV